jgi:hypothetical protein
MIILYRLRRDREGSVLAEFEVGLLFTHLSAGMGESRNR